MRARAHTVVTLIFVIFPCRFYTRARALGSVYTRLVEASFLNTPCECEIFHFLASSNNSLIFTFSLALSLLWRGERGGGKRSACQERSRESRLVNFSPRSGASLDEASERGFGLKITFDHARECARTDLLYLSNLNERSD